jgi:signal transduction histidine kinase
LQRLVDRVMYGDTRTRGGTALRLLHAVEGSSSVSSVVAGLASAATASLRASWVSIVVGELSVEQGARPDQGTVRTEPLLADEEVVGSLTVAFGPYRGFGGREEAALAELARHGGRAVRAAQLADDLLVAREQLITTREEERSRLRRDLHDELGPTLASLAMQLGGLASLIATDPAAATARVGRLEAAAREALEQVRETARALRPPTLDELGLVEALIQVGADLGVRVHTSGDVPSLPPAVEVAAFRIGAEALTNVARHSGQAHAELTVALAGSQLLLRIVDHGRGIVGASAGVGVLAMRERAEELGGTLSIGAAPGGGTVVVARIPRAIREGQPS